MLNLLLIGVFCINQIWCQTVNNIVLTRGKPYEFSNPTYPGDLGWKGASIEWNFEVESNAKVKVVCEDIRMMQRDPYTKECPHIYFSAIDNQGERKICEDVIYNYVHKSEGPNLTIRVASTRQGSGLFKCVAINTGEPAPTEIIQMNKNNRARRIDIVGNVENPLPNFDKLWMFESEEGTRISFQCRISLPAVSPLCGSNVFTFNNGEYDEEFCTTKEFVWFSKINKAKIRLQLDHYGHGSINCLIQRVTGPHPNEYDNIVSKEVDSSEHGVTPGARQTTCKCGWANKRSARIINGIEARVNEFPWMVQLHVLHGDNGNEWTANCGASIITARHVLTAAHCVEFNKIVIKPENVEMILAKHDSDKPSRNEISIRAERIFVRDLYLEKGLAYHDIALILTKQPIDFSTPLIGPICIEKEEYPVINRRITIMGWGLTENYVQSNFLRKSKARVMDPVICQGRAWDVCTVTKPSSQCNGDSGGPLVWLDKDTNRYSQISVVSRGNNNCRGKNAVSTLVAYFYDWIQDIIKATDPSVNTCHKI